MSTLMPWVFLITLLVLGLIAAAQKIGELIPASKQLTDYLKQSEGWVGLVAIFISLYWLIFVVLRYIGIMLQHALLSWVVSVASVAVMFALGLLFAKDQLLGWTKSNEKATGLLNKAVGFLEPKKEMLGLVALILALVFLGRTI
jgi:hypothetical protein